MRTKVVPIAVAAAALALLAWVEPGMSASRTPSVAASELVPRKTRVFVHDNFFDPRSVKVQAGGKVVWRWKSMNRHNVRFTKVPKGASRKGSRTTTEGRWKRRFRTPGTYRYVCTLFAGMRGTVTVVPLVPASRR